MTNANKEKKVALITAGASGIGRALAHEFLADNYAVHICDIDGVAIDEFLKINGTATASIADVSDNDSVERMFGDMEQRYGRLDVLINNAGIAGPTAPLEDINPQDWRRTVEVDLNGVFYCSRQAIPWLKSSAGSIINIASTAALFGYPLRTPYASCKWAVIGLTKTLAMELGPFGVRVNAICPGSVEGERIDRVIEREAKNRAVSAEQVRRTYTRQTSMRCFIRVEDIANMAAFLASDRAGRISGQVMAVDGHTESLSSAD